MANESVGKISLDLELTGDLSSQINAAASKIGEQLKTSIENINFKGIADNLSKSIKSSIDNSMKSVQAMIEKTINSALVGIKSIKVPVSFDIPKSFEIPKQKDTTKISQPRAPPIPKISTGINMEALKAQIDGLTKNLDIINAKIDQQKEKLAGLRESYEMALNPARKNKIQEQILQTEAKINSLTTASDKAGFKLSDLDKQFELLSTITKQATAGISAVDEKLKSTANAAIKSSNSLKSVNNSAKDSGKSFNNAHRPMNNFFGTMFKWGIVFPIISRGIFAVAGAIGDAFMANSQFSTSLTQIKTNLEVAFIPIYQAILPAINALMNALSISTAYIAAFVNALFGKTYQASYGAAKNLNTAVANMKNASKAAKEAKGTLSGFDQINQLQSNSGNASSSAVKAPELIAPAIDLSPSSSAMSEIQAKVDIFKNVLSTIFAPFKAAWSSDGQVVMASFKSAFDNIINLIKAIGQSLTTVWGKIGPQVAKTFIQILGSVGKVLDNLSRNLALIWDNGGNHLFQGIIKLGAKILELAGNIYSLFVAPLVNWFADIISPVIAKISDIIGGVADAFTKAIDTISNIIKGLHDTISAIITAVSDFKGGLEAVGIVLAALGIALLIYNADVIISTISMGAMSIAAGAWSIVSGIATIATTAFGVAVNFLTTPITLVILAIGALIAIGILLYKHWDEVKAVAANVWGWIKDMFQKFSDWLGGVFATDWSKHFGVLGDFLNAFLKNAQNIIDGIKKAFKGIIDFISGVFTGDWSRAWNGVKEIFSGIAGTFVGIMKAPLNGVIGLINGAITGLNKIKVPDWVPGIGGSGVNIPKIPYLARGGVISQPTLAMVGEAGKEAVMPLENNTGWIDTLASRINGSMNNQGTAQIVELLQAIVEILKGLGMDINLDGDKFGSLIIDLINGKNRQAGKNLIRV